MDRLSPYGATGVSMRYCIICGAFLEVDLGNMSSADKIFDVLKSEGYLQLHLTQAQFSAHYSFGSQTLRFLARIGVGIANGKITKWANADKRLNHLDYYKP